MTRYITVPIETNPSTLLGRIYSYLQARMPAWQPNTPNLDVWLAEAMASEAADTADTASRVPDTIYRDLGRTLYNLPPIDATPAIGSTTWVVRDNAGYTIPGGTQVKILDANNVAHTFQTVADVIILAGTNTTAAGAVTISAQEPGVASSALGGAGVVISLIDILDFVTSVTLTGATSGGADAESDGEYLNRLVTQTSLLTRTPILPQDFADVTVYNVLGVYRALPLDGYDPIADTFGNARMVTIFSLDQNGVPVAAPIKANVDAFLQALREVNFIVNEADAIVNQINADVQVVVTAGFDKPTVQTAVAAAITSFLNPATWGQTAVGSDAAQDPHAWVNTSTIYKYELAAAINGVEGVDHIVPGSLKTSINPAATAEQDLVLTGRVPIPNAHTITVTYV